MANFGMNPTTPDNQNQPGGQQPVDPAQQQVQRDPRSIRDYLSLARSQGTVPSFTNRPGGEGHFMPEPAPQAIPEGPQSDYEKMKFSDRMKMNPYMRAQQRMQTMLPELWQSMFPGMESDSIIDDNQMKQWNGAVQKMTSNLLKQFDKQYEWSLKNESTNKMNREKDRKFWQAKFIDSKLKGSPMLNEETGQPMTESEFVRERLSASDEMRFREETEMEESTNAGQEGLAGMDSAQVGQILRKNPSLMSEIKRQVMELLGQQQGRRISEIEFDLMSGEQVNAATHEVLMNNEDQILQLR
jgi:hypothetical protein